jgi:hypothetical protein
MRGAHRPETGNTDLAFTDAARLTRPKVDRVRANLARQRRDSCTANPAGDIRLGLQPLQEGRKQDDIFSHGQPWLGREDHGRACFGTSVGRCFVMGDPDLFWERSCFSPCPRSPPDGQLGMGIQARPV